MSSPAKTLLGAMDMKILRQLQSDGRLPNITLAERIGLSPSPCSRRVRLLEEEGVIQGYRAIIDRASAGFGLTVFAGVRVARHSKENADAFLETVLAMPEVVACHLVSGDSDFLLEVVVPDVATYEAGILRKLLAIPTISDIRTSIAMRTYKTNGTLPIG